MYYKFDVYYYLALDYNFEICCRYILLFSYDFFFLFVFVIYNMNKMKFKNVLCFNYSSYLTDYFI